MNIFELYYINNFNNNYNIFSRFAMFYNIIKRILFLIIMIIFESLMRSNFFNKVIFYFSILFL